MRMIRRFSLHIRWLVVVAIIIIVWVYIRRELMGIMEHMSQVENRSPGSCVIQCYADDPNFVHGVGSKEHVKFLGLLNSTASDSVLYVVGSDLVMDVIPIDVGRVVHCEEVVVGQDPVMYVIYRNPPVAFKYRAYVERAAVLVAKE